MRKGDVFQSKFLKGDDLKGGTADVQIESVTMENIGLDDGPQDIKPVMRFTGKEKGMIVNKTNWELLELFLKSDDSDNWAGAHILLWNDPTVMFKGERTGGLRVKGVAPGSEPAPPPPPTPTDDNIPF